jgi:hypothetical protein
MKALFETDYVIYDKANDHPLMDSYGRILIFGNIDDALDDLRGNEMVIPCTYLPIYWQDELIKQIEPPVEDRKGRELLVGDLVILMDANGLDTDDLQHDKGDILQYIGGNDDNIGCFIHCATKQRTDFFADRTIRLNKNRIAL